MTKKGKPSIKTRYRINKAEVGVMQSIDYSVRALVRDAILDGYESEVRLTHSAQQLLSGNGFDYALAADITARTRAQWEAFKFSEAVYVPDDQT